MATESQKANNQARKEARLAGRKTYVSPMACKFCETSVRYSCNGLCIECDRIKAAARKLDPEKAAADRARNAARVARYRAKLKAQAGNTQSDEFADILG